MRAGFLNRQPCIQGDQRERRVRVIDGVAARRTLVVAQLPRLTRRAAAYNVAATVHLGGADEIARRVEALLRIDPAFAIAKFLAGEFYKDAVYKDRLTNDLAKAGLPE